MKQLGVEWILSVSAVGSMKEDIHPGDIVIPDQFIDRTKSRASTFFGDGIAGHVAFADFDGDGKQDLAFANFYKQSGIQIIKIFYDFDKTSGNFKESKEIDRRSNMRITALVAGSVIVSPYTLNLDGIFDGKDIGEGEFVPLNGQSPEEVAKLINKFYESSMNGDGDHLVT